MPRAIPLEVVLSWPPPNFENPETHGATKTVLTVLLWTVVTAILGVRIYTRRFISYGFGWDDVLITIAYVPATAFSIVGIVAEYGYGWNRHVWDVPPAQISVGLQLGLVSFILFDLATTFTKLSMLALLYRMVTATPTPSPRLRWAVVGLMVINLVSMSAFIIVLFTQCQPLSDYWTVRLVRPGTCADESAHLLAASIINTIMDFIIVLLPVGVVLRLLELPRRQRIAVMLLFGAGLGASVAGIVRTYFTRAMTTSPDFDVTWHAWATWLASSVELYVGIICVSIPATKPFLTRYLPRLLEAATLINRSNGGSDSAGGRMSPDDMAFKPLSPHNNQNQFFDRSYTYTQTKPPVRVDVSNLEKDDAGRYYGGGGSSPWTKNDSNGKTVPSSPIQVERTVRIQQHAELPADYTQVKPSFPGHARNQSTQSSVATTLVETKVYSPNSPQFLQSSQQKQKQQQLQLQQQYQDIHQGWYSFYPPQHSRSFSASSLPATYPSPGGYGGNASTLPLRASRIGSAHGMHRPTLSSSSLPTPQSVRSSSDLRGPNLNKPLPPLMLGVQAESRGKILNG